MSSTLYCKDHPEFRGPLKNPAPELLLYCGFAQFLRAALNMADLGKLLVVLGIVLLVAGLLLLVLGRTNLPLGRLPGDILYRGKHTTFYFPLATSILLSVVLSLILYVISRWKR